MTTCSEEALEIALRALSEHAAGSRARANWISTYLVAQRMTKAGYPMTVRGAEDGTRDVFVLAPGHAQGRSNPFVDLSSKYRWTKVQDSGRSTVWNTGTRRQAQRVLFQKDHFQNGLLPNAIDVLLDNLGTEEPLPARDALAVFLTRDVDWSSAPTREELHDAAGGFLGISRSDFEQITADEELSVPVMGQPVWSETLLIASPLGPPAVTDQSEAGAAPENDIPVESVQQLPAEYRRFLARHGIASGGEDEILDILAATLSSQLVIMAGPSGTGKSLTAAALAAFFAPAERRGRLDGSRLLAKPQEFLGYYSHLTGGQFVAFEPLLTLLEIDGSSGTVSPMITIEEANLSPIEGYLSSLVHGLGGLETELLPIRLHTQPNAVTTQLDDVTAPPVLELGPYARFFATINVDADSAAPARKVVSRSCVVLLETPEFDTALAAAGSMAHPSLDEGTGQAAEIIGRPKIAHDRYVASGNNAFEQALSERATMLRNKLGADAIAHRQLQRSLMYMAWYVELAGEIEPEQGQPVVEAAADNALLHFVLPSLPATQFERALEALDDGNRSGVLKRRLTRLRGIVSEHQFGPPPDFWGALS